MVDNNGVLGGRRKRLPLHLGLDDPRAIAAFALSLGYGHDNVARALSARCGLDAPSARRIISDTLTHTTQEVGQ